MAPDSPRLRMEGITKSFPGVKALKGVSFDLRPGEVHALVGENGAGKSTLLKIMTGIHPDYSGVFEYDGGPCTSGPFGTPRRRGSRSSTRSSI